MDGIGFYKDGATGHLIRRYTAGPERNAKLYFTTENFSTDDRYFFFNRQVADNPKNDGGLYRADVKTGEVERMAGPEYNGFCLDRFGNFGVMCKGDTVCRMDADTGKIDEIGELPKGGRVTGHLTVSRSGRIACSYHLANKIYALVILDPEKGESEVVYQSDYRLGHAQICPSDENLIFYIHETEGDALQRTWMYDVEYRMARPYYVEHPNEWITHEVWSADGTRMAFMKLPGRVMTGDKDGRHFDRIGEAEHLLHPCFSRDMKYVCADRVNYFGSDLQEGIVLMNAETGKHVDLATTGKCKTGADHPHPSFNRKGDCVLFSNPDENGIAQVCTIDLNQSGIPEI